MNFLARVPHSFLGALLLSTPAVALGDAYVASERSEPFVELTAIPGIHDVTELSFTSADEGYAEVSFPFAFDFLGDTFRTGNLGSNGIFTFGDQFPSAFSNTAPGSSAAPDGFIAPFWDDLEHDRAQSARTGIIGAGRARTLVIEGGPASHYGQAGGTIRYQIWLYEGDSGRFEYRVSGTSAGGFTATVGYESAAGTVTASGDPLSSDPLGCSPTCATADLGSMDGRVFGAQRAEAPELTGSLAGFPRGALPGQVVSGEVTLRNQGTRPAAGVLATIYLSRDAILDASDVVVGTTRRVRVAGNDRPTTVTATLSVPSGTPAEDDRLILEIDTGDAFPELDETDNVIVPEGSFATAHDVVARAVAQAGTSPGANPGAPITFSVTLENQGAPLTGPLSVEIFASQDGALDPADVSLGQAEVRLRGLPTQDLEARVTLPALAPGVYTPIVSVVAGGLVELSSANNVAVGAASFPTGPDFAVPEIRLPLRPATAGALSVTTRISSEAVRFTGPLPYRLLASLDATPDAADPVLGEFQAQFRGEASIEDRRAVMLPASLAAGLYTVLAVLDPAGVVAEIREDNNVGTSTRALAAGTDFALEGPITVTPVAADAGDVITLTGRVASDGTPHDGPVPYRIYLSPDVVLDGADDAVSEGTLDLGGDAARPLSLTFSLPFDALVRTYHVILALDPDGTIPEASETNNAAATVATFNVRGADLRVTRIEGGALGFSGLPYRVQLSLSNEGAAAARGFRYAYYLSENELIRFTDTQIHLSETATIAAGETAVFTDLVDIPTFTSTRALYLGVIVDVNSRVPETSEGNNIARIDEPISFVFPIPNLRGEIIEAPAAAAAGESLAVTRILSNDGVEAAQTFDVAYYLSSNSDIGPDDILLGRRSSSLMLGEDDFGIDVLSVPANVPPGDYTIGMILDPDGVVREVHEDDNVFVGSTFPVFAPALTVVTESLPNVTLGVPYRASILASGAPLGLAFRVERGALPAGLALDANNGLIHGVATEEGLFTFAVRALSGTAYAERDLTLRVVTPTVDLAVASPGLPTGLVGRPYQATLVAVGGIPPYSFRTPSALPAGLSLRADGVVTGTPTAPGQHLVIVEVEDAAETTAALDLTLNLVNPGQSLIISQSPLPGAVVGREYCGESERVRLEATGGIEPYTWRPGSDLPPGLTLDPTTGELCGRPARQGNFPFTARVEDATGAQDTSLFVLRASGGTDLAITTLSLDPARVGVAYSAEIGAARGDTPYSFSIVEGLGALPPGLTLGTDGLLSGEPTAAGVFAFEVQVIDALGRVDLEPLAIDVAPDVRSANGDDGCGCSTSASSSRRTSSPLVGGALAIFALWLRARRTSRGARAAILALFAMASSPAAFALSPVAGTPYMRQTAANRYVPLTSPTVLIDDADDESIPVALPFSFKFYETSYDSIVVGANGAILFGASGSVSLGNVDPGSSSSPNAFLAPFWDDMQIFPGAGAIATQVAGTAPNRTFTVEYRNVGRFGVVASGWSAQVRLFEGQGGKVEIDYGPITGGSSFSATMAMEDAAGARPILFAASNCTSLCTGADFAALSEKRLTLVQDPGFELVATAVTGPTVGLVGGPLETRISVSSLHGEATGPFRVSVLLSRDADLGDPNVVGTSTLTLAAFERREAAVVGRVPANLPEGVYFLGLEVDTGRGIAEASESNNVVTGATPIRILESRPDLVVTGVTTTATAAPASGTVRVSVSVENRGSLPVIAGEVAVMLSTNPVISPEDAELARYSVDLPPGDGDVREVEVTIPAAASSGRFHLGALADPGGLVGELSESNNGLAVEAPIDVDGAGVRILTSDLPEAQVGAPYVGALLAAGGGPVRAWRVTQGVLPEGLGLVSDSGELYGRARKIESQTFTVEVTSEGATDARTLSLSVIEASTPLTVVTRDLAPATVGAEYSFQLVAVGGGSEKMWSGATLPDGLSVSTTGLISGVPTTLGTATISVSVASGGETATRALPLLVEAPAGLSIAPSLLPNARFGEAYTFVLSATGGTPPITFRLESGALPAGLTLASDGTVSGVPEAVRQTPFRFVVVASDAEPEALAARDTGTFELTVDDVGGFRIALEALPDGIKLEGYDVLVTAEGGEAPFSWSLEGTLPDGFATAETDQSAFRIAGLPTEAGLTPLLLRAVDARGRVAEKALALRVLAQASVGAKDEGCGCTAERRGATTAHPALFLVALLALRRRRR